MSFAEGATVTMTGEVTFASTVASGPLLTFEGTNVDFNGNGMMFNGNGADYWDGLGTNGGKPKPHPFIQIKASGTFENFVAYNTPAQAISVQPAANAGPLTITGVYVNNAAGDAGELGHNTDGFDVRGTDITIQNCMVQNQDDCVAINDGSNILFQNNVCSGGHGMSIGSIATGDFVTGVVFSHNTVSNSMYGTRVKAQSAATSGAVSNVTWTGNTISGAAKYGVLITQSYPDDDGTPGVDTPFSDVKFVGDPTSVTVVESGHRITVDCGNCAGTWDFSGLTVGGGLPGTIASGNATIQGGSY
ncbi:polygalacturonase [Fomitopsis serialis]|uniref:polygalacturonase n=1 Tax=Fomitopsis serialis TaxID=139415 RepID=UPI002008D590|nr:polygalacturonase [Neoantrodia serialis]KAH9930276.1 polygalacturonase [Neoantrodia serialis]